MHTTVVTSVENNGGDAWSSLYINLLWVKVCDSLPEKARDMMAQPLGESTSALEKTTFSPHRLCLEVL